MSTTNAPGPVRLAILGLILLAVLGGAATASSAPPSGSPAPPVAPSAAQKVEVGFYLISGSNLDFANSAVTLDFYLWLRFRGSEIPKFEFLNCKKPTLTKLEEYFPYEGTDVSYVVFRANGAFDQALDLRRYPFDRFTVRILFEDSEKNIAAREFVPDRRESGTDPMFRIQGWRIDQFQVRTLVHTYETTFGIPNKKQEEKESYSQAEVSLRISRDPAILFVKVVMPAILFLLIAVLAILLPSDQAGQKISLSVASLFSSVAYHLSLTQGLPQISYLTFVDRMMLGNYFTIFVNLGFTIFISLADQHEWTVATHRLAKAARIVVSTIALLLVLWLVSVAVTA